MVYLFKSRRIVGFVTCLFNTYGVDRMTFLVKSMNMMNYVNKFPESYERVFQRMLNHPFIPAVNLLRQGLLFLQCAARFCSLRFYLELSTTLRV